MLRCSYGFNLSEKAAAVLLDQHPPMLNAGMAAQLSAFRFGTRRMGLPDRLARSATQTRRTATMPDVSGVIRNFRPLPKQLTCAPAPRWMSAQRRPISSDAV
jgi:hypothetical protein